ncbi:uncharacterized protein LOC119327650 isoform X5 [Triticum dicoccoides]|uniref:uncharacterized protein LOC119327650 isoform X5 n=1 Tax=Triticum dicoccoides TaxID=85692 RepID=UPI00189106AB|nr:uncharacterized protein LOC119327650 isoform X5 [Triticum dicoccoides]
MHHSVICYFIVLVCCRDQSFQILNRRDKWPNVVKMATFLRTLQTAPSSLRPLTIKMLLDSFFEDTERYPLIIDGMPVSSAWSETNHSAWITARSAYMMALGPLMYTSGLMAVKTPRMLGRSTKACMYVLLGGLPVWSNFSKSKPTWTVKNFNDITHHFIYCIKAHIDISKQSRLKENSVATPSASTVMPRYQIAPSQIPEDCSFEDKIFSILRDPAYRDMDHGVSLKLLRSALGASQDDIMKVIIEQIRLGEMYTTIDERHFKSSN